MKNTCSTKRLIFCTYSSVYSSIVLEKILADDGIQVVAIINSTRIFSPRYNHLRGALRQIRFSGWRYASYLFMVTDLFRWLQPVFNLKKSSLKSIHRLAKYNNIPVLDTKDINNPESVDFIGKNRPETLLAAHFNQLIKTPILDFSRLECINIHPSLLPAYKGVDPIFFGMKDGQQEIGVTVHKMSENFDSGEILAIHKCDKDLSLSLFLNNCKLFEEGARQALNCIKNKAIEVNLPMESKAGYDSWPTKDDIRKFKKLGKHLINLPEFWNKI